MVTVDEMQQLLLTGGDVVGPDGKKVGSVGQLFLDARSGEPAWVTVVTGLFGTSESFVPLTGAAVRGDDLQVAYDKHQVKHAPRIDSAEGALSAQEERDLYRHYGLLHDDDVDDAEAPVGRQDDAPAPRDDADASWAAPDGTTVDDTAGPVVPPPIRPIGTPAPPQGVPPLEPPGTPSATVGSVDTGSGAHTLVPAPDAAPAPDDRTTSQDQAAVRSGAGQQADTAPSAVTRAADDGMVLRAEQPKVTGSERVPTERVRMRRYTVTEQRTITVPVTREEFRVDHDPAEGGEPLTAPDDDAGTEHPRHGRHVAGPPDDTRTDGDQPGSRDPSASTGR